MMKGEDYKSYETERYGGVAACQIKCANLTWHTLKNFFGITQ